MESSRLVSRLMMPQGKSHNPYTFGVGLPFGGFQEETMERMRTVFEFSPMGAAEYEFGAPQRTMAALWEERGKLTSFELKVGTTGPGGEPERGSVFVICRQEDKDEVTKRVKAWARHGGHSRQYDTRDGVSLDRALREANCGQLESYSTRGWLELNNGFFFTVDSQMAEGFEELLDMKAVEATGIETV